MGIGSGKRNTGVDDKRRASEGKDEGKDGKKGMGVRKRLKEGKGEVLARRCWEEIKERGIREEGRSEWEKERKSFFEKRGLKLKDKKTKRVETKR